MNRFLSLLGSVAIAPALRLVLTGLLVGLSFALVWTPIRVGMGGESLQWVSTLLALGATFFCAQSVTPRLAKIPYALLAAVCVSFLGTLASTRILAASMEIISYFSITTLESPLFSVLLSTFIQSVTFFPAVFGACWAYACLSKSTRFPIQFFLLAIIAGLNLGLFSLIPAGSFPIANGVLFSIVGLITLLEIACQTLHQEVSQTSATQSRSHSTSEQTGTEANAITIPVQFAQALLTGAGLAVIFFTANQLFFRSILTDAACLSGILLGFALTRGRSPQKAHSTTASIRGSFFIACWLSVIAMCYPILTALNVSTNALVQNLTWLMTIRVVILMAMTFPAGVILRSLMTTTLPATRLNIAIPAIVAMGCLIATLIPWSASVAVSLVCTTCLLIVTATWIKSGRHLPSTMFRKNRLATVVCTAIAGVAFASRLNPANSENLLFHPIAIQAARSGMSLAEIRSIDEGRILAEFETLQGRTSLWRYRGAQIWQRTNAITTTLHSEDGQRNPQNAAEVVAMALPLTFHEGAQDVLLLGSSPAALLTCHEYPLRLVRSLDAQLGVRQSLNWLTKNSPSWNLEQGALFQFGQLDPLLAMHARHDCGYDIIVSPLIQPATPTASSFISTDFYKQVARHLNEKGLFAQRIAYFDLDPKSATSVARSILAVFPEVMMIETVPGELVILASNHPMPAIDENLLARFQTPQTRGLLAQCGWDWSLILSRGYLSKSSLEMFSGERPIHSLYQPELETRLLLDVSRWGDKLTSTRNELAKFGSTLHAEIQDEDLGNDVAYRLQDYQLAQQLQIEHPNDPWGYRKSLKDRLQERPRSEIIQVKNEGLQKRLNPEDQRRKDYLVALGQLANTKNPDVNSIKNLTQFQAPFDPLLSMFVSYEAAQILQNSDLQNYDLEYQNLSRTINFASGMDQSTRNVARALELASDSDKLSLAPNQRWDEINSLLQTLANRWHLRRESGTVSKFEANDLEASYSAIVKAIDVLEEISPECGIDHATWSVRKHQLESALLRPVRQHRSAYLQTIARQSEGRGGSRPSAAPPIPKDLLKSVSTSTASPTTSE